MGGDGRGCLLAGRTKKVCAMTAAEKAAFSAWFDDSFARAA